MLARRAYASSTNRVSHVLTGARNLELQKDAAFKPGQLLSTVSAAPAPAPLSLHVPPAGHSRCAERRCSPRS